MSDKWTTDKIERQFAPLFKWAEENEGNEDCQDSIDFVNLSYRRIVKNPAGAEKVWRQCLNEGEAGGHENWPVGGHQGRQSNLPEVIKTIANNNRDSAISAAEQMLDSNPDMIYTKLYRPQGKEPQMLTATQYLKATGQSAYNATVNLFKDKLLTINEDDEAIYHDFTVKGSDDSTEEE